MCFQGFPSQKKEQIQFEFNALMVLEQDIQMASNRLCDGDNFAAVIYNPSGTKFVELTCLYLTVLSRLSTEATFVAVISNLNHSATWASKKFSQIFPVIGTEGIRRVKPSEWEASLPRTVYTHPFSTLGENIFEAPGQNGR